MAKKRKLEKDEEYEEKELNKNKLEGVWGGTGEDPDILPIEQDVEDDSLRTPGEKQ